MLCQVTNDNSGHFVSIYQLLVVSMGGGGGKELAWGHTAPRAGLECKPNVGWLPPPTTSLKLTPVEEQVSQREAAQVQGSELVLGEKTLP